MKRKPRDPVDPEWRRLLNRIHRNGTLSTSSYVSELVRKGGYPLWYQYQLTDYLIKRGELEAAEMLLKTTRKFEENHFLIDMLYTEWLWCMGRRKTAFRFAKNALKLRPNPAFFNLVSAMYHVTGDGPKAEKYLQLTRSAAEKEKTAAAKSET